MHLYLVTHSFSLSLDDSIFIETWRSSVWLRDFGRRRRRCHRRRRRRRRRSCSRHLTGIMLLSNKSRSKWRRWRRPRSGGGRQRRKRFSENLLLLFSAKIRRLWEITKSASMNMRYPFLTKKIESLFSLVSYIFLWSTLDNEKECSIVSSLLTKKAKK